MGSAVSSSNRQNVLPFDVYITTAAEARLTMADRTLIENHLDDLHRHEHIPKPERVIGSLKPLRLYSINTNYEKRRVLIHSVECGLGPYTESDLEEYLSFCIPYRRLPLV